MKFGKNTGVNYKAPIVTTTTQANPKLKTQGSDPASASQASIVTSKTTQVTSKTTQANKPKIPSISVASEILGITMIMGGFLFSKYIF